jgi:Restriction endonuclease BglII
VRKVYEYSHLGGSEILRARYPKVNRDIDWAIAKVKARSSRTKVSKEKTRTGRMLYAPKELNRQFAAAFALRGFTQIIDRYTITIPDSDVTIRGGFKQIDFVRDGIHVEVQFGKYFSMFYDMAKFQYFFNEGKAKVGVEIVPTNALKRQMSSGVSYGEQLVYDIERLRKNFPQLPVKIILIDVEDEPAVRHPVASQPGAPKSDPTPPLLGRRSPS